MIANFVACYLVGVPLGLLLSFHYRQNLLGLWWGQVLFLGEKKSLEKIL